MATLKTAISMQEQLFERLNELAEELRISRSQLVARAVEEFIERYESRRVLDTLNQVYGEPPDAEDEALRAGRKRHHRRMVEGQW